MAGFASFVEACVAADPTLPEASWLIHLVSAQQTTAALEHSVIWDAFSTWIRRRNSEGTLINSGRTVTTAQLYSGLRLVASTFGNSALFDRLVPSARSLGHQMKELIPDIESLVDVETVRKKPNHAYRFTVRPGADDSTATG
jgi:hypothetical protein